MTQNPSLPDVTAESEVPLARRVYALLFAGLTVASFGLAFFYPAQIVSSDTKPYMVAALFSALAWLVVNRKKYVGIALVANITVFIALWQGASISPDPPVPLLIMYAAGLGLCGFFLPETWQGLKQDANLD